LNNPFDISVIIPTYNRKYTLDIALDSVLNQTITSSEIIVVDDGSTDGTSEWIDSKYPSVKLFRQKNQGVSSARNAGIKQAKGDWIALLDSDDEWFPDKLEKQVQALKENPDYLFCHTNEIWIRNGIRVNQMKKHQKYGGPIFEKCLDMCRISPSSSLIHKSILEDVGLFDEKLKVCEDYDLWLRITVKYSVLFLDEPLIIKYGGHEDQLSKVPEGIEQYRIQSLEKILLNGKLTYKQKSQMIQMLKKKYRIYANGLKKRERWKTYEWVMKKMNNL
jgi:glycosyltransferase involved in cell wall biosynthesis